MSNGGKTNLPLFHAPARARLVAHGGEALDWSAISQLGAVDAGHEYEPVQDHAHGRR